MHSKDNFLVKFEKHLDNALLNKGTIEVHPIFIIRASDIQFAADFLILNSFNLHNLHGYSNKNGFTLVYLFRRQVIRAVDSIFVEIFVQKQQNVNSLSGHSIIASLHEKNIQHRLGVSFSDSKSKRTAQMLPLDYYYTFGEDVKFETGIFNPIHKRKQYLSGQVNRAFVKGVRIRDGWQYQKIQPELEKQEIYLGYPPLFDQISATANVHLNLGHYMNLEKLFDQKIPIKVKYIRMLLAEIERIRSHLIWYSNLALLLQKKLLSKSVNKYINRIIQICTEIFPHPYLQNTVQFGSAADLEIQQARRLWKFLKEIAKPMFKTLHKICYSESTLEKTESIGVISSELALHAGMSGPNVRGSGHLDDKRMENNPLGYLSGEVSQLWNLISFPKGDIHARNQVRLWEIKESLSICAYLGQSLANYEFPTPQITVPESYNLSKNVTLLTELESPQGTLGMLYRTSAGSKTKKFETVRIFTPDTNHYYLLEELLLDQDVRDIPFIVHSLDLHFRMIDK